MIFFTASSPLAALRDASRTWHPLLSDLTAQCETNSAVAACDENRPHGFHAFRRQTIQANCLWTKQLELYS